MKLFLIFRAPCGVLRLNLFRPARFLAKHVCGVSSLLRSLLAVAKNPAGLQKDNAAPAGANFLKAISCMKAMLLNIKLLLKWSKVNFD